MSLNTATLEYDYYPDPTRGRPVFNGSIFVGVVDTDPEFNQLTISAKQEDGTVVPLSQPVSTSAGGVPQLNGSPIRILVDGNYSLKVLNSGGSQVYYLSDALVDNTSNSLTYNEGDAGAVDRTITGRLQERVSALDFMTNAQRADVLSNGKVEDVSDALMAAAATGKNFHCPEGTYVVTKEVLSNISGQLITGDGAGEIIGKTAVGWKTRFFTPLGTTVPSYIKTRRKARTTGADPQDAPLSCILNLEGENSGVSGIFFELECDYNDTASTNLGADCDVAVFIGCRTNVEIDVTCLGYWRVASVYLDVTRGTNIPEILTPGGTRYNSDGTNGADRFRGRVQCSGGLKGVAMFGPILNGADTYFDQETGSAVTDTRGGSGASDFTLYDRSVVESREHHSGFRAYDPTLDPDTDDLDALAACVFIDSARGSTSQGRTRRLYFENIRLKTIEAARFFFARSFEVYGNWVHTEPASGTVRDTSGNIIDITDYVNVSYGPVACQTTSGNLDGSDELHFFGLWGTAIQPLWSSDRVTTLDHTRRLINPQFAVTLDSDLTVGDDLTVNDQITGANLNLTTADTSWTPIFLFVTAPTFVTQLGSITKIADMAFCDFTIEYTGLDIADTSTLTIGGIPDNIDGGSTFSAVLNVTESTGISLAATDTFDLRDNGSASQLSMTDLSGGGLKYNSGKVSAAGIIKGSFVYRF